MVASTRNGRRRLVAQVLRIPEIFSKILSYMDFKNLKETILVNHLWKAESEIYFKQKAIIDLNDSRKLDKVGVQRFLEICKSHQNFKLRLFVPYHQTFLDYADKEILNFVLSFPPPRIKFIHLELCVYDSQDFILKFNILSNLAHLKKLKLSVDFRKWEDLDIDKVFPVPQLTLVTKLDIALYVDIDRKESDEPKMQKLCRKLVLMTPNLEELVSSGQSSCHIDYMYLEEIVRLQKEWKDSKSKKGPIPFQNLSFIYGLRLLNINISENLLKSCLEFMQPFKGLGMFGLNVGSKLTLEKIFHKNSTTLENLEIHFLNPVIAVNIVLPVQPRLGRLSLANGDVLNLRELLLMGSDKFKSTFPKLHSLVLDEPENFLPLPNCLDLSFPQFTTLEVNSGWGRYVWESDKECFGNFSGKEWAEWMSKLFPNVHNPWINKARENIQAMI